MKWFSRMFGASALPATAVTPAHEAATRTRRGYSLPSNPLGPTRVVTGDADIVRGRARHAERNDAWAAAGIESLIANIIGQGIAPHSLSPDPATRQRIMDAWAAHVDECDADGATTFAGLQAIACNALIVAGECFGRLRYRDATAGLTVPLQLQLLEADHVATWNNADLPGGRRIVAGIEFDGVGRRVAYHMLRRHPGEFGGDGFSSRVPAEDVLHLYRPRRPGQVRGMSWLTPALMALWDFHDYDDAERKRKHYEAMIALFIRRGADGLASPLSSGGTPSRRADGSTDPDAVDVEWSPGSIFELDDGQDVHMTDPAANAGYADYARTQGHRAAAGLGTAFHQMTGDLREVNYSSIRAGLLELQRRVRMLQEQVIIPQFCRRYWSAWFAQAVLSDAIRLPAGGTMTAHARVQWFPPGWEWVDPLKEVTAATVALKAGITSRREVVARRGRTLESVFAEIAEERALAERYGIALDDDVSSAAAAMARADEDTAPPAKGKKDFAA